MTLPHLNSVSDCLVESITVIVTLKQQFGIFTVLGSLPVFMQ